MREIDQQLINAASDGDLESVKKAVEDGADVNAQDEFFKDTALHKAASAGHESVVEYLIENGSDMLFMNGVDFTPLHLAARDGQISVVRLILEKIDTIPERILNDAIHVASMSVSGSDLIVRLLDDFRTKQVKPSTSSLESGTASLLESSENGDLEGAVAAIESGANVNATDGRGMTPLLWASLRGHLEIVEYLLDHGADIKKTNTAEWTALMEASLEGHAEIVKLLIERGANVNARTFVSGTALMFSSGNGHLEVVKILLDNGADKTITIDGTDGDDGMTALAYALRYGRHEIVELLQKSG
ncbi:MAG: ankyrin repeat domain-containing protein [Candidatus Thorarchaeota archaeon]|nr:ankyrin repeat domain-containing protein [Candidatus Thorarchaeota archaeon]